MINNEKIEWMDKFKSFTFNGKKIKNENHAHSRT